MMARGTALNDVIDEVVRLRVKPNAFLYALEASRLHFVIALVMSFVLMPAVHFRTGLPIGGFMLLLVLTVYGLLSSIFFVLVVFAARCVEFIATSDRAHDSNGKNKRQYFYSNRIDKSIEIRSCNARYGSVYFKCDEGSPLDDLQPYDGSRSQIPNQLRPPSFNPAVDRPRRLANLVVRSGSAPVWLSMPSTSPPLSGFYGFRHFDTFTKLVLELQAAA
jgi:hypothetical protein